MLSHTTLGTADPARAFAVYDTLLAPLGLRRVETIPDLGAGWASAPDAMPQFWVMRPFDGGAPSPGNGTMLAFSAPNHAAVEAFQATALAGGGRCEGPPGLRPQVHADFCAAYVRDPDGNKIACVSHRPAPEAGA
jgi:catechol 2,3-dioxygenase-like lactoylglutathione lyase family enzyme